MSPAPRKADERRQRRNSRTDIQLVRDDGRSLEVPDAPREFLKRTRDQWVSFWGSPLAELVEISADLPAIYRLFTLYDERERAYRAVRKKRMVEGSQGQPVLNPIMRQIPAMDSEIRQLEDRMGLTPKARANLGIAWSQAKKATLADLNRSLERDD